MDDLQQRLRERGQRDGEMPNHYVRRMEIDRTEAADALAAKDAEVARIREAIARTAEQAMQAEIPQGYGPEASAEWMAGYDAAIRFARAALTGSPR